MSESKRPGRPARGARVPLAVLGVWTVAVWVQRIVNLAGTELGAWSILWRVVVAIVFIDLGVALLAWVGLGRIGRKAWLGLAALSVVYWPVRTVQLWAGDGSTGFKLVHLALALGTLAAVAYAYWGLRRSRRPTHPTPEPSPDSA